LNIPANRRTRNHGFLKIRDSTAVQARIDRYIRPKLGRSEERKEICALTMAGKDRTGVICSFERCTSCAMRYLSTSYTDREGLKEREEGY